MPLASPHDPPQANSRGRGVDEQTSCETTEPGDRAPSTAANDSDSASKGQASTTPTHGQLQHGPDQRRPAPGNPARKRASSD